jgi:N6-adenosine-specific RNA methylase IME4
VNGNVKPFGHQERNIYKHQIGHHSAKPHFFREPVMKLADKSFTESSRLELFARTREGMFGNYEYEGWDVFGNEVENSIRMPNMETDVWQG